MEDYRNWQEAREGEEDAAQLRPVEAAQEQDPAEASGLADMLDALKADMEQQMRAALDEAVRMNGMTPEEKLTYETQNRLRALEAREKALERRELKADAQEKLAGLGLPAGLAEALNCEDRAAMERSVKALGDAFDQAVQAAVEARLKGTAPAAGASAQETGDELDDAAYYSLQEVRG